MKTRNTDTLQLIKDQTILLQYLYMNEEHTLHYKDMWGNTHTISMSENLHVKITNDKNGYVSCNQPTTAFWCDLVQYLKDTSDGIIHKHAQFENKFDEIKTIVAMVNTVQ